MNNVDPYFFDSLNPNLQAEILMMTLGEGDEGEEPEFVHNPMPNIPGIFRY